MTKPSRSFPRPLSDLLHRTISERFAQQGFASTELVTRWADIAGDEIAAHSQPIKITWPRQTDENDPEPATLVLRVDGPMALEIQHQSAVILERVNRFFGWQAIGKLALRQAPLHHPEKHEPPAPPDPALVEQVAGTIPEGTDEGLKAALARLGASLKSR
ncbi:MAG: DUF721 domain-containing protein [Xanthobacteraceae bacterium]|uniref:DUF721 domain-containing protein n=1 Tax=Pseudolabrys sp. TaxID=1960880 RepID=UPI003D14A99E